MHGTFEGEGRRGSAASAPVAPKPVAPKPSSPRRFRRAARRFGLGRALALALLAVLVLVRIWDPFPVEAVRLRTFDAFQVLKPRPTGPSPVAIVDIDEASLRELGQWPWPRTRVADLVDRLTRLGAAAIAFDIVFAEPDRTSPAAIVEGLRDLDPGTRERLLALPSNDRVLADSFRQSRVIVGQTALADDVPVGEGDVPAAGVAVLGPGVDRHLRSYKGLLRNVPELEAAAAGRGLFTIAPERDGIVRRVPVVLKAQGAIVPTLSLELLRVLTGSGAILIRTDEAGIQSVRVPGFELPTDAFGQVWVHFSPHDPKRFIAARDLLAGRVPQERVANKIVLVGTSAVGLLDNKTTPVARSMPGVEIHAQLLESVLARTTLSAPNYAGAIEILVTILVALAIIWLAPVIGAFSLLLLGAAVAATLASLSWYRYAYSGVLLDATYPLAASFMIYATLVFTNYFREQVDRRRIRSAFSQYLSPALVEQLAQSPEKLSLGGEERTMTIMFSDVRGFTGIAELYKHDPQGLTGLMNRFLTPLTNAIIEHRGTIDKYMGDAIMAFWNAPLADRDQEANACASALAMLARMRALNAEREAEAQRDDQPFVALDVGIGLNTGRCVVGNMGSNLRFDYSVLGDTVNLASRLEGQSKTYGVKTILGSRTAEAVVDSFAVLEIDLLTVKGKSEPEHVFTLLGDVSMLRQARFGDHARAHARMLALYRAQSWDEALSAVRSCRDFGEELGLRPLYDLYALRIAAFMAEPPPADWNGIFEATTK